MDITFVADAIVELNVALGHLYGGAELYDDVCIKHLRKRGHDVSCVLSRALTKEYIEAHDHFYIVSNFVQLQAPVKSTLGGKDYIIIEHDHKYCLIRNVSDFENFKVPKKFLINVPFYENAVAVCTQTKMHTEVVSSNLPGSCNVVNMGGSLWSEENLVLLETHCNTDKVTDYAVMKSDNPIKNMERSIKHCEENNLDYKIIGACGFDEFIEDLSKCRNFIFFPTVLETCCRVIVEARMVNCGIKTNGLIGATSEDWFKLKGQELIDFTRENNKKIVDKIENLLSDESLATKGREITVILNAYRRTHLLKEQIERIRNQSVKPKHIWVWVNHHEDAKDFDFNSVGADRVFLNDHNWKFYGRFAAALLADTEYVALFDDDTMPGEDWLKNCLQTMKAKEGILGGIGVELNSSAYADHVRYGWASNNEEIKEVDLVGHAWFFRREWLSYLWREKPSTWENGEDIQFAYLAQKYGGIRSYVPPHPQSEPSKSSSQQGYELGVDSKATSAAANHHTFYPERDAVIANALEGGWKLLKDR
jgi:hypothetical protein